MALTKTRSSALLSNVTASASSSTSASSSEDLSTALQCAIEVVMAFNASATDGATLKVYASGDDTNWDTNTYDEFDIPVSAGNTIRQTFPILPAPKYIRVVVTNLDGSYSITGIYAYAITQESG